MFNIESFSACIRDNLKDRRFGKERADEIIGDFERRTKAHMQAGRSETDASMIAMRETFDNLSDVAVEKAKRTAKMIRTQAENMERIKQGLNVDLKVLDAGRAEGKKKTSRGEAIGRAAVSLIEDDPRFNGLSYSTTKEVYRGQLFAIMGDVLDKFGKGAFGKQNGKAHLPNVVKEIFGEKTGDASATELAEAWLKVSDLGADLFNQAGGSMKKLARYMPQGQNAAKAIAMGKDEWFRLMNRSIDWDKTRWPDGGIIDEADRAKLLLGDEETPGMFDTFATDGGTKIDPTAFRGKGRAVGNAMDNHRFLHYKNADAWLEVHDKLGDGNVFDVMSHHIENMAHKTALVETFGPNPDMTAMNIEAMVRRASAGIGGVEKNKADDILKNKFRPMMDLVNRTNPMNPESVLGNTVVGVSNILTAAQLGSAALLAMPGDFLQTTAVRALNNMDLFGGINHYFKTIATDRAFMGKIAAQSGFVMDDAVIATYATQRFTGMATVGPAVTRRISDTVMRASMMAGHTKAARWATQSEFMGLLSRSTDTDFDALPFSQVMRRYGITAEDWDAFRKEVTPHQPRQDVNFLRPIDILNTKLANKQELYRKFQGMVFEESRKMVPESTIEATSMLKGTSRPDTLVGAILHSFSMYKNFPISFWMIYGRLGMTSKSVKGRLGFYAGLGAGMTMVGAIGTQMREVAQGRDPMPMDTPAFMGKAFLSGGALSIWGDFLFGGVNRMQGGATETVAGPGVGFFADTTQLAFGDVFKWAESVGTLDSKEIKSNTPARLVEYMKRYTPGSNVWWSRLALERQVWDRLQELADPKTHAKRRRKEKNQKQTFGNESWWPAGESTPDRLPHYNNKR